MHPIIEEKIVKEITGYRADDGTWFRTEDQCKQYEESATYAAERAAKEYQTKFADAETVFAGYNGCYEDEISVYDIKDTKALQVVNTYLASLTKSNEMIRPEYIGHKVCVQRYAYDVIACVRGTRAEMESEFSALMDKLFKDGDDNAES